MYKMHIEFNRYIYNQIYNLFYAITGSHSSKSQIVEKGQEYVNLLCKACI